MHPTNTNLPACECFITAWSRRSGEIRNGRIVHAKLTASLSLCACAFHAGPAKKHDYEKTRKYVKTKHSVMVTK